MTKENKENWFELPRFKFDYANLIFVVFLFFLIVFMIVLADFVQNILYDLKLFEIRTTNQESVIFFILNFLYFLFLFLIISKFNEKFNHKYTRTWLLEGKESKIGKRLHYILRILTVILILIFYAGAFISDTFPNNSNIIMISFATFLFWPYVILGYQLVNKKNIVDSRLYLVEIFYELSENIETIYDFEFKKEIMRILSKWGEFQYVKINEEILEKLVLAIRLRTLTKLNEELKNQWKQWFNKLIEKLIDFNDREFLETLFSFPSKNEFGFEEFEDPFFKYVNYRHETEIQQYKATLDATRNFIKQTFTEGWKTTIGAIVLFAAGLLAFR